VARTAKRITNGLLIAESLSVGILGRAYPRSRIRAILSAADRQSVRQRDLPMEVMVYYVIALGLFLPAAYEEVLRCLVEGLGWIDGVEPVRVAGKSAIAQARRRLGSAPLAALFAGHGPRATPQTPGSFFRGLRLVSMDGTTLAVPDTPANVAGFGRSGSDRGQAAFPSLRFVALVETGTHLIFAAEPGRWSDHEQALARRLIPRLGAGMLVLADRNFAGQGFLQEILATGAQFLVRLRLDIALPIERRLPDGSYLSRFGISKGTRKRGVRTCTVRVVEYTLEPAGTTFRLVTSLLDPAVAPAAELSALYPQRWEHEGVYDEFKTHLRGAQVVLRSKTPELVRQEFYGLCLAHYAVRSLMLEAADQDTLDPDRLSFTHAVRVVRRKLAAPPVFSPCAPKTTPPAPPA
jgi:hypothetical protein